MTPVTTFRVTVTPGCTTNSGSANIYLNGPASLTSSGNTAVNTGGRPQNLRYFGLPSLTSVTFSGNSTFVGVIYAPGASVTLNGGGGNSGLIGSLIVNDITMHGHYDIHFDESLATNGPAIYVIQSWQEL